MSKEMIRAHVHRPAESGSALVYVFIGIILFAALLFVFARGAQTTSGNIDQKTGVLTAADILEQGHTLESAVNQLISNGCTESDISFDPIPYTANQNPLAPADKHCHIFHSSGARLNGALFTNWKFSSLASVKKAGSDNTELIGYIDGLSQPVCQKLNDTIKNGYTTIPLESGTFLNATFQGTYPTNPATVRWITSSTTATDNSFSGCLNTDTHTPYVFYKALLVR